MNCLLQIERGEIIHAADAIYSFFVVVFALYVPCISLD